MCYNESVIRKGDGAMITMRIEEDDLLEMLMERLSFWTEDSTTSNLFEQYYEDMIYSGCFEGAELDVMGIVDNDYVNWLDVVYEEDFDNYNIEDEEDDRIVARTTDENGNNVYLVYCG